MSTPVTPQAAYPDPLDAIVLAGTDDNPRRMILGQNKAFLQMAGQTLVERVVDALLEVDTVGQVFVVGPLERLRAVLGERSERVTLVAQSGQMLANAWEAIHAIEARWKSSGREADPQRPILFLSCDLPLISPQAVADFIARCAHEDSQAQTGYSMLCGVAEEASLRQYYPDNGKPGIRRPYVNMAECRVRLANIYVGRPRTLTNQAFLQVGFEHRKAEKWKNVLYLIWRFLSEHGGLQAAWLAARMQATLLVSRNRDSWLYQRLRKGNTTRRTEAVCSRTLGGAVRMVITPYGGLSLDADNEDDFRVLNTRFEEWISVPPAE